MLKNEMKDKAAFAALAIVVLASLSACEARMEDGADTSGDVEQQATQQGEVNRVDTDIAPQPVAMQAIRSVPFAYGSTLDITNIEITGDIMTVEFRARTTEMNMTEMMSLDRVNYIEDETSRQVEALRDSEGNYPANPITSRGDTLRIQTEDGIGWIKFPKPAEGVTTISLTIPDAGALNGLPVPSR